jgi:hypothetical protein
MAFEVCGQQSVLRLEVAQHLGVARIGRQLGQLEQVVGALDERAPGDDLVAQALGRTQGLLGAALVGPEVGPAGLLVESSQLLFLGG